MDDRHRRPPNEYAADRTGLAADDLAHDAANVAASGRKRRCDRGGSCCSASGRNGRQKSARRIRPQLNSAHSPGPAQGVPRIGTPAAKQEGQSQSASAFHSISA